MAEVANNEQQAPQFNIQRVYTKDVSFETPNSPAVFQKEWNPEVKLDLDTRSDKLEDNTFEVVLSLTVTARIDEEVAFLCEVQQAGIFSVPSLDDPQMAHMLAAFCPNILFPYAREALDSLVTRGSFPALMLSPVNFDALYAQEMARMQSAGEAPATAH